MIVVLDAGSNKTKYIETIIDNVCDVRCIPFLDAKPTDFEDAKGIVISGAPILITEVPTERYLEAFQIPIATKLPLLGICFGHQLLGLHFGAEGSRMKEDRDWQTIEAYEESILFERLPQEVEMKEDHCESISIPAGFQLVASSDACVNEAMQHKELPYFGVQFHPEVSGNHGAVLLENFASFCLKTDYP